MTVHLVRRRANYATVPLSPGGWLGVRGLVHRSVVGQSVPARFSETLLQYQLRQLNYKHLTIGTYRDLKIFIHRER